MVGPDAASTALVEKMLRVMLLAPAVLWIALQGNQRQEGIGARVEVPVFLWLFLAVLLLNLSGVVPESLRELGALVADMLLATGLAALGMLTRIADIRATGARVWVLALLLWSYLLVAGFGLVKWLSH